MRIRQHTQVSGRAIFIALDVVRLQLMRTVAARADVRIVVIPHATLNGTRGSGGGYMTKADLIYELTRTFSQTPDDSEVFVQNYASFNRNNMSLNVLRSLRTVEVDVIDGKSRIVLS